MRPTDTVTFPILGLRFRATDVSRSTGAWLRSGWDFPVHRPEPRRFTIRLRVGRPGTVPRPDDGSPTSRATTLAGPALEWWLANGAWWWGSSGAGVRLRIRTGGASVTAWGLDAEDRARVAVYVALCEAVRAGGYVPLHASVVAGDDGATAFLGASGAGKSTALLKAAQAGWTPVAEDLSWVDPVDLRVYGWDRALRLWPESVDRFAPELRDAAASTDERGKLVIPYEALHEGGGRARRASSCRLRRVLVLERSGDRRSSIDPLPAREAVRVLWEASGVPLRPDAREVAGAWVARCREEVETGRLTVGTTPVPGVL